MPQDVLDILNVKELRAEKFGLAATPTGVGSTFTVTNHNADLTLDCDGNSALVNADVLGSLIDELITKGIIAGSVSS